MCGGLCAAAPIFLEHLARRDRDRDRSVVVDTVSAGKGAVSPVVRGGSYHADAAPRKRRSRENQVRTGLTAGGRWIRTFVPLRECRRSEPLARLPLPGGRLRASGPGRGQRRRGHRANITGRRDVPFRRAADDRPHRLRPLPARAFLQRLVGGDNRRLPPLYPTVDPP
jgi:hypothetical protein